MNPPLVCLASESSAIKEAAATLRRGGLVVFPTDTVYGVGADPLSSSALEALFRAKFRPRDKAIPLLLAHAAQMSAVARQIPPLALALAKAFWPGGLTLVLPRAPHLPAALCAGGDTIAVRIPDHPVALALIEAFGRPVAATSANLSGSAPATTAQEAESSLGGVVDLILDGGRSPLGQPSTIMDLTVDPPRILRQGALPAEELLAFIPRFTLSGRAAPAEPPRG